MMKYIAFYDTLNHQNEKRSIGLSSVNVVEYMAETLAQITPVELVSPTRTLLPRGFFPGRTEKTETGFTLVQPPTWGVKTKAGRLAVVAYTQLWLLFYLLRTVKPGEIVVAYHSLSTMLTLRLLKKIKGINLCLEIREIYTDINESTEKEKQRELKFFTNGDSYIFPTELLNQKINTLEKPYVIASGIYKPEKIISSRFQNGKIHVVYAGTFRKAKGGAVMAVRIAEFLDERYHMHIFGEGGKETKALVLNEIERVKKVSKATITYDGVLRGNEFKQFLQKCHIGLSTQTPEGNYNDSSFPSKILTYMSNGLEVLSIRIPAVETSPVGKYIHYYDHDDPEEAAERIKEMNLNSYNTDVLDQLQDKLVSDLSDIIQL